MMLASIALLLVAQATRTGTAAGFEARVDVAELYTMDDLTDRHVSFSEVRTTFDQRALLGAPHLELHLDGRARKAWNDTIETAVDVTRAFLQYGDDSTFMRVAIGRMAITSVGSARVDGGLLGVTPDPRFTLSLFGGLAPHPFTGAVDRRFLIGGTGYEWKSTTANHAGGGAVQLFDGALDRVYFSERLYLAFSPEWMLFGFGIVDVLQGPDLTNAHVSLRWRPARSFDVAVSATHFHAIVPNLWWQDWIREERARRGFIVDGEDPLGTRRSGIRIVTNVHASNAITPYAVARYDRRHDDSANGYEGQLGVKYDLAELGYADLSVTERHYFEADSRLATLSFGAQLAEALNLDVQGTAMRSTMHAGGEPLMLYDVGAGLWLDLRVVSRSLEGLRLLGQYQTFIEPELTYHVFFAQLSYTVGR